ncbi:MAG: 16S rRNA (cytosine(1402)-N(4))-methyltransferase RsmH [Candidatus Cryptobacteroides sp.]
MSEYHTPVLLNESVSALVVNPSGTYVDATYGGGGHTGEILSRLSPEGRVIAFDRDSDAILNRIDDLRLSLVRTDFRFAHNHIMLDARNRGENPADASVDGILADLGVSSHQFDTADRGFSFRFDAPLDMRMNTEAGLTAADVVNTYPYEELEKLFRLYGEVDNASRIAKLIVSSRASSTIATTGELDKCIAPAVPDYQSHKVLAKIYQALRIEVNHEMRSLEKFLESASASLKEGGRLVVITYHSLEDRMVKNYIKAGNIRGEVTKDFYGNVEAPLKALNRKPILPEESEIATNTRARSAKLRVAVRTSSGMKKEEAV